MSPKVVKKNYRSREGGHPRRPRKVRICSLVLHPCSVSQHDRKELLNTEALVLGPSRFCESGMGLFMDAGSRSKHSVQTVMVTEHLVGPQGCDLYPAGRLTACRVRLVYEHP